MEHAGLHLSIPAPLNRAGKPLSRLARDLEADPPAQGQETASIAGKARPSSSLGYFIVIIQVLTYSTCSIEVSLLCGGLRGRLGRQ
jgi:hypothetical protein